MRIWKELGFNWVQGGDRLVPPEPYINRTRSSFPYGKNDQLFDNQPRRTRRPCPCRQLLPSVAGSGGGMPHGMRSRLDGVWTRARNIVVFPASFPARITPGWCEVRNSSFVAGFTENPSAPATLVTLLDTPAVPLRPVCCGLSRRLDTRPCEPRSRLRWGLFCSHTPIAQGLPAAQAVCPAGWRWYLAPWGRVPGLPRRPCV